MPRKRDCSCRLPAWMESDFQIPRDTRFRFLMRQTTDGAHVFRFLFSLADRGDYGSPFPFGPNDVPTLVFVETLQRKSCSNCWDHNREPSRRIREMFDKEIDWEEDLVAVAGNSDRSEIAVAVPPDVRVMLFLAIRKLERQQTGQVGCQVLGSIAVVVVGTVEPTRLAFG